MNVGSCPHSPVCFYLTGIKTYGFGLIEGDLDKMENEKFKYANRVNQLQRTNRALIIGFGMFTVFLIAAGIGNVAAGTMNLMSVVIVGGVGLAGDIIITILAKKRPEDEFCYGMCHLPAHRIHGLQQ